MVVVSGDISTAENSCVIHYIGNNKNTNYLRVPLSYFFFKSIPHLPFLFLHFNSLSFIAVQKRISSFTIVSNSLFAALSNTRINILCNWITCAVALKTLTGQTKCNGCSMKNPGLEYLVTLSLSFYSSIIFHLKLPVLHYFFDIHRTFYQGLPLLIQYTLSVTLAF